MVDDIMADSDIARKARKKRLLEFYQSQGGLDVGGELLGASSSSYEQQSTDPCDIDGPAFEAQIYLNKLLKERSLTDLMDKEKEMIEKIRSLDSEMQTLVYDNYNKFIHATDTIRNMKTDFKKMEEEMSLLAQNMNEITRFSVSIRDALHAKREDINNLAGTHHLLRKLQYLFELPQRLRTCVSNEQYLQAVRYYTKARAVLDRYQDMPSFQGIRDDCHHIMAELTEILWTKFRNATETQELSSVVDVLRQLGEPSDKLAEEFIRHSQNIIKTAFENLRRELHPRISSEDDTEQALNPFPPDVLHFANIATDTVLDKLSNHVAVYNELFLGSAEFEGEVREPALEQVLVDYLDDIMPQFFEIIYERMAMEKESGDNTMFVRAMDRFHSRLQALNRLVPQADFARRSLEMVCSLAHDRSAHYLAGLKRYLTDCLTDARQRLAGHVASRMTSSGEGEMLQEVEQGTSAALVDQIKATMNAQQSFIAMDNTFSKKPLFQEQFCRRDVREGIVVAFLRHMTASCRRLAEEQQSSGSTSLAPLLLILSRLCFDWSSGGTIEYILTLADEQFLIGSLEGGSHTLTPASNLVTEFRECAHLLLNGYVRVQGLSVSQMIRKSVETRDWLNSIEPRSARSVMKRVIEDVTQIDQQVGQLFEMQNRNRDRGSDSSRRAYPLYGSSQGPTSTGQGQKTSSSKWSQWSLTPSTLDNTIFTNIQKLFEEKIDIFAQVEPFRESILTGVIKIGLKTFMECVRMRTFGKYGLQQIQVDCRYLQIYLWKFVADEKLVNFLLDEVIGSVLQRCVEPILLEETMIESICERS